MRAAAADLSTGPRAQLVFLIHLREILVLNPRPLWLDLDQEKREGWLCGEVGIECELRVQGFAAAAAAEQAG